MLVEEECYGATGRAVRYAISHGMLRPYGTFREGVIAFSTHIPSLTGRCGTRNLSFGYPISSHRLNIYAIDFSSALILKVGKLQIQKMV